MIGGLASYRTPPINRCTGLRSTNMTTAAPSDTAAVTPNSCASGIEPKKPAVQPASRFPSQFDRKKTPIMRLTMRVGASFVTALKPTGLRHSSHDGSFLPIELAREPARGLDGGKK